VKPANFLLKTNKHRVSEIYLIDFGLSTSYHIAEGNHIALKTNERLIGTQRYMSVHVEQGFTPSRRDDLESLGYILMYLHQGRLPWQDTNDSLQLKQNLSFQESIGEFILFIYYCRNLAFAVPPNYDYLRSLLTNLNKIA
jgi:serine/threonine protein kinase